MNDRKDLLVRRNLKILPVGIEVSDSCVVYDFWVVGKADLVTYETVTAERMLTRLLAVEDRDHFQVSELLKHIKFLNLSVTESGGGN